MLKPHILIVDDHPENLISLHAILDCEDYKITSCNSGAEALKCLLDEGVDLILLDIQMPVMDGFQTAALVRSRSKCDSIPIIFITAVYDDELSQLKGYESGAADYLVKPIKPEILRNKVDFFLNFSKRVKREQHHVDSDLQLLSFMKILNKIVDPLWYILLNVQMLKKISAKDRKKVLITLDKKLENLELSTRKLKELLFSYRNEVEEQTQMENLAS